MQPRFAHRVALEMTSRPPRRIHTIACKMPGPEEMPMRASAAGVYDDCTMIGMRKILESVRLHGRLLLILGILGLIGACMYLTIRSLRGASLFREAERA